MVLDRKEYPDIMGYVIVAGLCSLLFGLNVTDGEVSRS